MRIETFNKNYQGTKDIKYIEGALAKCSVEDCLEDKTFFNALFKLIRTIGESTLKGNEFVVLSAKEDNNFLVEELFAHVCKKLQGYDPNGALNPWLNKIAYNFFIDQNRVSNKINFFAGDHFVLDIAEVVSDEDIVTELARDFLNSLQSDRKASKEFKRDLVCGDNTIEELASKYGVSLATANRRKKELKEEAIAFFEREGIKISQLNK